jgi:hypothetical protein
MTLPSGSLSGLVPLLLCLPVVGGQPPLTGTEDLYIAEPNSDRIAVFDGAGTYLRSFTTPGLDGPRDIAFGSNDLIYVACSDVNEIVVFDRVEQFVMRFGAAHLDGPQGLAINSASELVVVSEGGDRLCVFALDGTFLRWFDAPGLSGPEYIAFDSAGSAFVTGDTGGIFKWDAAEQFVGTFAAPSGFLLAAPAGIAVDANDILYVAGSASHNVLRFGSDGTFLSQLKHPDLVGPQGLAPDDEGNLFAASMLGDALVMFDASGAWVETFDDPNMHFPWGLAFAPGCPAPVAYCTAGTSASGCQATLTTSGSASASKSSGFLLQSTLVEGDKDGWFFYGTNGRQASTWGNGTSFVCMAPPVKRGRNMTRRGALFTCDGWFVMDLNARWCSTCPRPSHNPGAGAIVQAQLWYRDPLNTSYQTTSMSAAVEFLVCP